MVLRCPDASASQGKTTSDTDVVEARFIDIVPDVKVTYAVDFMSDDPAYASTMVMTWEVTAVEGGTRVDITANNVWCAQSPLRFHSRPGARSMSA